MSWPHQMWNPSGSYSHVASADSVVTNLTEPEAPGQINVLSQDCFASPGAAITGLQGAAPLSYAGPEDVVVSSIIVNPRGGAQYEYSAVTPNITTGPTVGSGRCGIYLDKRSGSSDSQYIGFARAGYDRVDKGIACVGAAIRQDGNYAFTIFNWSTVVSTGAPFKTGPLFPDNISTTVMDTISSINGVSWASISTAAATV